MADETKPEETLTDGSASHLPEQLSRPSKAKSRSHDKDSPASGKRRCVSTACIACRRRKSKCDGNTPSCAACASVYGTECIYDPNSDHRRKGVYKKDIDNLKTRNSTLQTLIQAILNYPEHEVPELVRQIRTCESLDDVAESILTKDSALADHAEEPESPPFENGAVPEIPTFETELSGKMGELRLDNGSVRFIGGTSNLIFLGSSLDGDGGIAPAASIEQYQQQDDPITSWTTVTSDPELVVHLINMYFTWHYTYFTTLSKSLFYRDFLLGKPPNGTRRSTEYCTPLLVNAMLTLGCHFTSWPAARTDPQDSATAGDHFFKEAKRLILENDEHENPRLPTVQALALMSVREAGCGREAKGWVYSGMSFRMACDLGLNVDSGVSSLDEQETDARRITFWGCFLFDKCWSNYLGRQPQLTMSNSTVPKPDVFPMEDSEGWSAYTDLGFNQTHTQPSRTRAVALQISLLCEISSDLLGSFYHPTHMEKPLGKQAELKKLSELHTRLEGWRKNLPKEMESREGQLPSVLVMHMFFQLLFIHLFRPFLKYNQTTSPLPSHVSPRKLCTHAAATISKLLRLYKRTYGLRQICNIAVYIAHSACTIHLLNMPEKTAKRDFVHGVKHLEEISEGWLCARRTLSILSILALRWKVDLPDEAAAVLTRTNVKFGYMKGQPADPSTDNKSVRSATKTVPANGLNDLNPAFALPTNGFLNSGSIRTPASTPDIRAPAGTLSLPPQSAAEIRRLSRHHQQLPPPEQSNSWNQDWDSSGFMPQPETSPTALFTGIDVTQEDSQNWWLKDQSALAMGFENWNGTESDSGLTTNGVMNGTRNASNDSGYADFTGGLLGYDTGGTYQ